MGSARMIWAAISPSLSSAKKTALRVGSLVAAQNGLAHQVFGCGAFFSLKAAQVALQPLGVGSKEKVALAQLAQVVGPAERLVDPVQGFGILIKAMRRHLVLSG